jgi:hypothetical protein
MRYTCSNLYVVHPRCGYAIGGGVGPSNTTELGSVLYLFCDDMFRPRKVIFRSISILQKRVSKNWTCAKQGLSM